MKNIFIAAAFLSHFSSAIASEFDVGHHFDWNSPIQIVYDFTEDDEYKSTMIANIQENETKTIAFVEPKEMKVKPNMSSPSPHKPEEAAAFIRMLIDSTN